MERLQLRDLLLIGDYVKVCSVLELDPVRTIRDPVRVLPMVAIADLSKGQQFLKIALKGSVPDLENFEDEDEARMLLTSVFVAFISRVRRQARHDRPPGVQSTASTNGKDTSYS